MFRFTLFSFLVSFSAVSEGFVRPWRSRKTTPRSRRLRRGVAVGLLLAMLTPFAPAAHAHAGEVGHETTAVPTVEAEAASSVNGVAAVHGCSRYISTGPSNRPGRGVLRMSICHSRSVPLTLGFVTCEFCTCWYLMNSGMLVNLNQVDCGSAIVITGPGDDCEDIC